MSKQIVILDRGFVYVGDVSFEGDFLVIDNGQNIRRWGTKAGLGELAVKGPLPETKLDAVPQVRAPLRSVIHTIACEAAAWSR